MTAHDPVDDLALVNASASWVQDMEPDALWIAEHRIMVLNASRTREELSDAVRWLFPDLDPSL